MWHRVEVVLTDVSEDRIASTSVNTTSTRCHIPEDGFLHSHRRENLKSSVTETVKDYEIEDVRKHKYLKYGSYNTVTCMRDSGRSFGFDTGFIDHFSIQLVIVLNHSSITGLHKSLLHTH
jgi:hypothetical protein